MSIIHIYLSSHIFYYTVNTCPEAEFYGTLIWVHLLCTRSGAHIAYPIGYIKCVPNRVPSLDLLSAEPMSYKARLGARFVYPIGYYMYVPDRVHNSLYPPSFQGLLEFCSQAQSVISFTYFIRFETSFTLWIVSQEEDTKIYLSIVLPSRQKGIEVVNDH